MRLEQRPGYRWVLVALLWCVGFLNYVDRQAIFSVFPLLREELALSDLDLALLGTVFLWVYGFSSPLGGYLGDRLPRRVAVLLSLSLFSAVTLGTGFARSGRWLLALRGCLGISEAIYLPAALSLIGDYHRGATRSRAISLHQTGLILGGIAGGVFAGYMGDRYGWRPAFYLLGGIGTVLVVALAPLLRESPTTDSNGKSPASAPRNLRRILRTPSVLVVIFSGMSMSMASWVVMAWMPLYMFERFGLSLTRAGFDAMFYFSTATVLGLVSGSVLSDRWAKRDARGRMLLQAVGLTVAVPGLLAVHFAPAPAWLVSSLFLFGVGRGLWDCNNMPIFCDLVERSSWSTTYGVFNFANTLGGGIGVLLAGMLRQSVGIGGTLSVFSALLFTSTALTFLAAVHYLPNDIRKGPQQSEQGALPLPGRSG
jgi:predicted MFS family arabinose efflux permease